MARSVEVALKLDDGEFKRGIKSADRDVSKLTSTVAKLGKALIKATTGAAIAVSALVVRQSALGASLVDTADKLGLNVEFLQRFRFAANQSGVSTNTADMALQRFTRRLAEAANGTGEARDALRQMGIGLRDNQGNLRSAESVLGDVSDAMARTENAGERVRLAFKLFDSEGVALVNTLDDGSIALNRLMRRTDELGGVISETAARDMKAMDDSITELRTAVGGLTAEFVSGLLPAFKELAEQSTIFAVNNRELARGLGEDTAQALRTTAEGARVLSENIDLIRNSILSFFGLKIVKFFSDILGQFRKNSAAAKANAVVTKKLGDTMKETFSLKKVPIIGTIVGAIASLHPVVRVVTVAVGVLTAAFFAFRDASIQVGDTTTNIGEIIAAVWNDIKTTILTAVDIIVTGVQFAWAKIVDIVSTIIQPVKELFNDILIPIFKNGINTFIGFFVGLVLEIIRQFKLIPQVFGAVFTIIGQVVSDFITRAKNQFKELFDFITSFGETDITNQFAGQLETVGNIIKQELATIYAEPVDWNQILNTDFLGIAVDAVGRGLGAVANAVELYIEGSVLRLRDGQAQLQEQLEDIKATAESLPEVELPTVGAQQLTEMQKFLEGVRTGYEKFKAMTEDTAAFGEQIFNTMANGFSDAITNFVMTGKLSFKDLFKSLMADIIKMQANKLFLSIFGAGGPISSLFAGFFDKGGRIPGGKFGIVGERGPELVRGPANVIGTDATASMMGGGSVTHVTYNISAVDSRSFKDLVASDPSFIYNVTRAGARRSPR